MLLPGYPLTPPLVDSGHADYRAIREHEAQSRPDKLVFHLRASAHS